MEDNIWTMDGDGELRLTIMATLAQEESRKVSERVKAGQHLNDGIGATKIANELCNRRRVAASGKIKWTASNVGRILANPTYMGYMAYGKSFSNN